jgi:hypothetical protein
MNAFIGMSAVTSCYEIFHVKYSYFSDRRRVILDVFKAVSVSVTAVSHSWSVIGAPLAYYLFDRIELLSYFLSQPISQSFSNEAGLGVLMVMSGFTAFQIMWKAAKTNELPFVFAFIDRVLKFLPAMIAVVSIEMIWPLLGSGPLYTRYSKFNLQRCSKNGWMNLLFINNWNISAVDICAPQTFFASVIVQMLLLSLVVMWIMRRNEKFGLFVCWILIIASNVWTGVSAFTNNVTPTLLTPFPNINEVVEHISAVHTFCPTQCAPYFMGFLLGFYITEKKLALDVSTWTKMGKWISITAFFSSVSNYLMVAGACFDLIPRQFSPLFVLVNRGSLAMSTVVMIMILYSLKDFSIVDKILGIRGEEIDRNNNNDGKVFSWLAAFHRLSLGVFFTNMTVVHYDIFTRRRLIPFDLMSILSRSIFILVFVMLTSLIFTVVFIHPAEKLLSHLYHGNRRNVCKTEKVC